MAEAGQPREQWGSRWGLIFAALGAAIGTGNIWRFPREAAVNGGGAFMLPWLLFLFSFSIPLLIAEFTIGKHTRFGTIGAFKKFAGKKYAWMGAWMMLVNIIIMFYYAVVMGWVVKYFTVAASGGLSPGADTDAMWKSFITSPEQVVFFQVVAICIGTLVVYKGIAKGIERTNKILIPLLFILLIIAALWAISLPGAIDGLKYLFIIRGDHITRADTWVSALSQSAFSTSAGFGMAITYAVYMRRREDTTLNAFIAGLGNNAASLIAGIAVICTVFALSSTNVEAIGVLQDPAGNEGLAFIHLTRLFTLMPGGLVIAGIFFLAMAFAAITSMISGMEITVRNFMDHGWSRNKSLRITAMMMFVFGLPSALIVINGGVPAFLKNQDHVWSLGLIVSGLFVFFAVWKFGVNHFRETMVNTEWNDLYIGRWWTYIMYLFPIQFIFLMYWFLSQSIANSDNWWNPLEPEGFMTIILQWGIALAILICMNNWLNQKALIKAEDVDEDEVVEVVPEYG